MVDTKKILIYAEDPANLSYKVLKKELEAIFDSGQMKCRIKMSWELEKELASGEFGLVIDALGIEGPSLNNLEIRTKRISRDSEITEKYDVPLKLASNPLTIVKDISDICVDYFHMQMNAGEYDS